MDFHSENEKSATILEKKLFLISSLKSYLSFAIRLRKTTREDDHIEDDAMTRSAT